MGNLGQVSLSACATGEKEIRGWRGTKATIVNYMCGRTELGGEATFAEVRLRLWFLKKMRTQP